MSDSYTAQVYRPLEPLFTIIGDMHRAVRLFRKKDAAAEHKLLKLLDFC